MSKFKVVTPKGASFTVAGGGYDYEREALDPIGAEIIEAPANEAEFIAAAKTADAIYAKGMRITKAVIDQLENCKVITLGSVGVDSVDGRAATARRCVAIMSHHQRMARLVVARVEPGEALVLHQHQKADFRQIGRRRRIEPARPVLDRVEAVGRQRPPGRKRDALEPIGREALHGIAVDAFDAGRRGFHADLTQARWR